MFKRDVKQIGTITEEIALRHKISELANRPIVQSLDFFVHIAKHVKEFKNVDSYNNAIKNIEAALLNPEFTFYDKKKQCILYYTRLDECTCYAVNINIGKDYSYIASLYPVSDKKMQRKKEESYLRQD